SAARSRDSVLRNAPFGLVLLLWMMPAPIGKLAFIAGAVLVALVEGWKVWRDPLGIRLGDGWAETQVVDGKVPIGASLAARSQAPERAPGRVMFSSDKEIEWREARANIGGSG